MLRAINEAKIVTPDGVFEGSVVIEEGRIAGLSREPERTGETLDAAGRFVLPGMVDLHCDAVEKQLSPRPSVEFSAELAFLEMDRAFAASGITTGFHGLSFMEGRGRSMERALGLCSVIRDAASDSLARHELHLRCELPQRESVEIVESVLSTGGVRLVSIMDHTPGQGQFRDLEWFRRYWIEDRGRSEEQVSAAIAEASAESGRPPSSFLDRIERVSKAASRNGAILASHDDDSPEKVETLAEEGVSISEFPVDAATARRAKELGISVSMGAPNVVRGGSSGGNLSAVEAVRLGLADTLVSDYHPPSMLLAAFALANRKVLPLHEATKLVSSGPANAAGLADRGTIEPGKAADLLVVGERLSLPTIAHTVVDGTCVVSVGGSGFSVSRP
jgi:alpha-D-ribose 1-methylphosphonate 5-triphosphate diphosphatase